jgi:uncharacterized membrane protein YqjE
MWSRVGQRKRAGKINGKQKDPMIAHAFKLLERDVRYLTMCSIVCIGGIGCLPSVRLYVLVESDTYQMFACMQVLVESDIYQVFDRMYRWNRILTKCLIVCIGGIGYLPSVRSYVLVESDAYQVFDRMYRWNWMLTKCSLVCIGGIEAVECGLDPAPDVVGRVHLEV